MIKYCGLFIVHLQFKWNQYPFQDVPIEGKNTKNTDLEIDENQIGKNDEGKEEEEILIIVINKTKTLSKCVLEVANLLL